jgi:hypothetical protein
MLRRPIRRRQRRQNGPQYDALAYARRLHRRLVRNHQRHYNGLAILSTHCEHISMFRYSSSYSSKELVK